MLEVLVLLKTRLKVAQQEIRSFNTLPESEKNLWFGPLVLVAWAVTAWLVGPSEPQYPIFILDPRQYFSFIGGYWFLSLIILSATTYGVMKNKWSRYLLSALAVAHFIFYVSYNPDVTGSSDGQISLFSGNLRAGAFFELIPLAGALMTVKLESAQWMRIRMARIIPAIRKSVERTRGSVNQSGYSAANRAWRASRIVEAFGWINIVVGVIAGIILIVLGFKGMNCDSNYEECTADGIYVGYGFGVIFACIIQGSFFVMIGAFISSRTTVSSNAEDWNPGAA